MSSSDIGVQASALASRVEELLRGGDAATVADESVQELLRSAVRLYAAKVERQGDLNAVPAGSLTATDVMVTTTALLRAVNLQVFELGLWQSWAG